MNRWAETANGGSILRTGRRDYLARPCTVGMSAVRHFPTEHAARAYAEGGNS